MSKLQTRRLNPADHLKPAGRSYVGRDEGAHYCLVDGSADPSRPVTPEKLRKYRAVKEPAARSLHPGYRGDTHLQDPTKVHGAFSDSSAEHTADLLDQRLPPMEAYVAERSEAKYYASARTDRVGKGYTPATVLPLGVTANPNHAFGKSSQHAGAQPAIKDLVSPPPVDAKEVEAEAIYAKSHHSYPPGVQRRDGVDWSQTRLAAGSDPRQATFGGRGIGGRGHEDRNAVGYALNPQLAAEAAAAQAAASGSKGAPAVAAPPSPTKQHGKGKVTSPVAQPSNIVPKAVADFRRTVGTSGPIGASVTAAATVATGGFDTTQTFGRPSRGTDDPNAGSGVAACLKGAYSQDQVAPDATLGRRMLTGPGAQAPPPAAVALPGGRAFGLPSVRRDRPEPQFKSVADHTDYGGPQSGTGPLITPSPYVDHGVDETDFAAPRPREEIRSIFASIGHAMPDDEFDHIYAQASMESGLDKSLSSGTSSATNGVSVEAFRRALDAAIGERERAELDRA